MPFVVLSALAFAPAPVTKWRPKEIDNGIGMRLVRIDPGAFEMGSPAGEEGRREDEGRHGVRITKTYWMGVHEVTQSQFAKVMGYAPASSPAPARGRPGVIYDPNNQPGGGKDRIPADTRSFPVENVSWDEANEFCDRLSRSPKERGLKYRLPTEAEWEYACRAGTKTRYHGGDDEGDLRRVGRYEKNGERQVSPVGSR